MTGPWPAAGHRLAAVLTPGERVGVTPPPGPTTRKTFEYVGVVWVCHTIFHMNHAYSHIRPIVNNTHHAQHKSRSLPPTGDGPCSSKLCSIAICSSSSSL